MGRLEKSGAEEITFQGRIVEVVNQKMVDGEKEIVFEWARRSPGTRVLLVDPENRTIRLTKEHRYELGADDFRLPGGKVFDSLEEYNAFLGTGQDIIEPARQKATSEAGEEAGVRVHSLEHLETAVNGTTMQWDLIYFVSTDWDEGVQALEAGETSAPVDVSIEEAIVMMVDGRISEDRSVAVMLRWFYAQGFIKI